MTKSNVDVTPTPRILRILGEIPFLPWQCLAELIDNSIDAFLNTELKTGVDNHERQITVNWSKDSVPLRDREVTIKDNACGMSLEEIRNAVRAGFSNNDPINNLGLFGMGFNIATARLGEVTTVYSTRSGDSEWVGLRIDFEKMIKQKLFIAFIVNKPKKDKSESGTEITITTLKQGISDTLISKERELRNQLESIYTPLLTSKDISIIVKGNKLSPRNKCVWSASRYVIYNEQNVSAVCEIDRDLGTSLFDTERNRYLTKDEAEMHFEVMLKGGSLPDNIVNRNKRLKGWLGIQRYADPDDFGIDFIRNGRKILISDKSLFSYNNPLTGQKELQYPVELGSTVGGRIVGELNVDYLLPTYQKNDFDRTDASWFETIDALCGEGPFLPKKRKDLGYRDPNTSYLGLLVNAYRRVDPGTKCLFAPNDKSKSYAKEYSRGTREYMDDTKWWELAKEKDQERSSGGSRFTRGPDSGTNPTDDVDTYIGGQPGSETNTPSKGEQPTETIIQEETSAFDDLIKRAKKVNSLSGNYSNGRTGYLKVNAYELQKGEILSKGISKPCFFKSDAIDCDFIYNPFHPTIAQYPITSKQLLLQYLAEKLKARDIRHDLGEVYSELVQTSMSDSKIDRQSLQERAISIFAKLRDRMSSVLADDPLKIINAIKESKGEEEKTIAKMIYRAQHLLDPFQTSLPEGYGAIEYVPEETLVRLVKLFPEKLFDGKVFAAKYSTIKLSDENATERIREESKERIISFLKDALRLIMNSAVGQKDLKNELSRASLSIEFLVEELG